MPWIELHSNLREHPKTAALVELMGFTDCDQAVGKLARLWLWALEYAPDGNLSKLDGPQIARASGIDPASGDKWRGALTSAGWLDVEPYLRIHDWWDYVGRYLKRKWERRPDKWESVEKAYLSTAGTLPEGCGKATGTQPEGVPSVNDTILPLTNQPTLTSGVCVSAKRLHGAPASVNEVIAHGATLNPPVSPEACREFWAYYEGQARTNPSGDVFWVTRGDQVVTNWKAKLPSFGNQKHATNQRNSRPDPNLGIVGHDPGKAARVIERRRREEAEAAAAAAKAAGDDLAAQTPKP